MAWFAFLWLWIGILLVCLWFRSRSEVRRCVLQASTDAIADFFQSGPPTTSPQRQESRPSEGPQRPLLQSDIETASHGSVQEAMSYLQDSGISVSEEAMCRLVAEKLAVRPLRSFAR